MDRSLLQGRFATFTSWRNQHRRSVPTPVGETDLYEACSSLIAESRRSRIERDKLWAAAIAELSRSHGYCRSLLSVATTRLIAQERDRPDPGDPHADRKPIL
ncbi:hypothetical protein SAMN05444166_6704 [Singulisphaera sp. GP187]|uniref:hypothetical protein n=1 Tax=Singulisphaera sp. GP187 TaxID=1882752 RepID=UPI000928270D|nr:hypothetical protein [Singulisphaera sp. GP187]SIO61274.1 hypothetical protein SAMN05444166_6704 [Singulisphaera sp. GP187]